MLALVNGNRRRIDQSPAVILQGDNGTMVVTVDATPCYIFVYSQCNDM